MAITHLMLQSNLFLHQKPLNNPTIVSYPIKWSSAHLTRNYFSYNTIRASPKMGINCITMNHKSKAEKGIDKYMKKVDANNEGVIWRSIENVLKALQKPVITGVVVLLGLLLLYGHGCQHALAASGGSMGGSDFSSSDSYSSSSSSDSDSYSSSYYNHGDSYTRYRTKTRSSVSPVEPRLSVVVPVIIFVVVIFLLYLSPTKKDTSVLKLQVFTHFQELLLFCHKLDFKFEF